MILLVLGLALSIIASMLGFAFFYYEDSFIFLMYLLGSGWIMFLAFLVPIIIARRDIEIWFKLLGQKSKKAIFRMIGNDANENEIILPMKGNTIEIGDAKIIVNPKKSTVRNGAKVFTYVGNNALAHDFFQDPNKTLKEIAKNLEKKSEDLHDVFTDPIRIDAKYFNETFLAAQQSNPDILKQIISFLTSKNIIIMLGAIALAAAAAAFLSLQANNILNTIPICQAGTIST